MALMRGDSSGEISRKSRSLNLTFELLSLFRFSIYKVQGIEESVIVKCQVPNGFPFIARQLQIG